MTDVDVVEADTAAARATRIRNGIHSYVTTLEEIADAYQARDWASLGYASWEAYLDGEFGEAKLQLAVENRRQAVAALRITGMSQRAIGAVLGVDHATVSRDLATGADAPVALPERVTSLDGRDRPASRPVQTPAPTKPPTKPSGASQEPDRTEAAPASAAAHDPRADGQSEGAVAGPDAGEGDGRDGDGAAAASRPDTDSADDLPVVGDLLDLIWQVLDTHGNRPYGLTIGQIWARLTDVHGSRVGPALDQLAAAGRAVVMGHASGTAPMHDRARWLNVRVAEPQAEDAARVQAAAAAIQGHADAATVDLLAAAVAEFPELAHYADRPAKALALAQQLRTFDPPELAVRRGILAKTIQAEKGGRLDPKPDQGFIALDRADRLFLAVNNASQVATKVGGETAIAEALGHADPMQIDLWRDQFTAMAELCTRLAAACRPALRSVR